jgi:hypothetical protein
LYSNGSNVRCRKLVSYRRHADADITRVHKPDENAKLKRNAADAAAHINQISIIMGA